MQNFLEQLVAEWFEFQGYYVRRNIRVGKRSKGGHAGELDVVAFHPVQKRLVQIEPSMDADTWAEREARYKKKFKSGRAYVPGLFKGLDPLPKLEQIALFVSGAKDRKKIGGGKVMMIGDLMREIKESLADKKVLKAAVPEQYVILRSLQFAVNYWK